MKKFKVKKPNVLKYELYRDTYPPIEPTKSAIPKWYKDAERWVGGEIVLSPKPNPAVKLCVPFLDSLTSGYLVPLICDVLVQKVDGLPFVSWKDGEYSPLDQRPPAATKTLPIPAGHADVHYIWKLPMSFKVPDGYSVLVTHPFNRFDLPFTTLTGIVDANFEVYGGNLPFYLNKDFEGIISRGTPIALLFPFKRESWKAEAFEGMIEQSKKYSDVNRATISGWYKKSFWQRKEYE